MNNELLRIKEEIELLNKSRQVDILQFFLSKNIPTTENKNGNFINLSHINEEIIQLLNMKLAYFKEQDDTINEMEKIKQGFHESFFNSENIISDDGLSSKDNKHDKKQDKENALQYAT
jgi:hypothetical protein